MSATEPPPAKYPVTISQAAQLTGVAASTLATIAARLGVGRRLGNLRVKLLSRSDLAKILAEKRPKPGRPPCKRP